MSDEIKLGRIEYSPDYKAPNHEFLRRLAEARPGLPELPRIEELESALTSTSQQLDAANKRIQELEQSIRSVMDILIGKRMAGAIDSKGLEDWYGKAKTLLSPSPSPIRESQT